MNDNYLKMALKDDGNLKGFLRDASKMLIRKKLVLLA